jgi:hypothetical protein
VPRRDDIPLDDRLPGGTHAPKSIVRRAPSATGPIENYNPRADDDEGPSDADLERFGHVTTKCPACGTEIMDDVAICYKCGHAILDPVGPTRRWVWWVAAILAVAMIVMVILFGTRSSLPHF